MMTLETRRHPLEDCPAKNISWLEFSHLFNVKLKDSAGKEGFDSWQNIWQG